MDPSLSKASRARRMLALLWALALSVACPAIAADPDALLELVVERNALGDQVALSKWDSGKPVLDPVRETEVLQHVRTEAAARGLDADTAANFFAAQIEANKLVQYQLLQAWRASGRAPSGARPDLAVLRAHLDRLQDQLLMALARNAPLRTAPDCASTLSVRLDTYAAVHRLDTLHRTALVRGLGDFCAGSR
jgi:chorismate mutase